MLNKKFHYKREGPSLVSHLGGGAGGGGGKAGGGLSIINALMVSVERARVY